MQVKKIAASLREASKAKNEGDFRRAHEILSKLVESNPGEIEARFRFGQLLRILGHHGQACEELKYAELDPNFANFAYFERFRIEEFQLSSYSNPNRHLMKSLVLTPMFLPSMAAAMKIGTISVLRISVAIGSAVGLDEHFNDAIRRGFNGEAERLLKSCLCSNPKLRVALFWGSRIARSLENQTAERKLAGWAAVANSTDARLQILAAASSFRGGDFELAEIYTRRSIALTEDNAEAWFLLGRLLWLGEETTEAKDALAKAASWDENYGVRAQIVMAGIEPNDFSPDPPPLS